MNGEVLDLLSHLNEAERAAQLAVNLTPSENAMSPLARLPFQLDMHDRYFFDDLPTHGIHAFFGGLAAGDIENDILKPALSLATGAKHINVRPLSGLSCMAIALSALASPGQSVFVVPPAAGGHASTILLGTRLGLRMIELPMRDVHHVDYDRFAEVVRQERPAAVYIDQSTELFPLDPAPLRRILDESSPETLLHYDGSHINGLIVTGAVFNPLERGADGLGGSTHKTLPGPHKGFLATNNDLLAARFDAASDVFVSQHQPAAIVSLAITMLELQHCGGHEYGQAVLGNAKAFAHRLAERGLDVSGEENGYTACHQVWVQPASGDGLRELTERLTSSGLRLNRFGGLPGTNGPAFRTSLAEVTRMGADGDDVEQLADLLADAALDGLPSSEIRHRVESFREKHPRPKYCYEPKETFDVFSVWRADSTADPVPVPAMEAM